MRLCAIAGAPFFSVHGGFAMSIRPEQLGDHSSQARESAPADRQTAAQIFISNVRALADEAVALGLRLLLENNVVSEAHRRSGLADSLFLSTPDDIESFFAHWQGLPVGLLLDTGHARVTGNTLGVNSDEFFALSHRIEAFHLSDNDGLADSNKPFASDVWFAPHLRAHADKPMVIEVYGLDATGRRTQWDVLNSLL
jgi:sugar phosphate isomerase/epimerase